MFTRDNILSFFTHLPPSFLLLQKHKPEDEAAKIKGKEWYKDGKEFLVNHLSHSLFFFWLWP